MLLVAYVSGFNVTGLFHFRIAVGTYAQKVWCMCGGKSEWRENSLTQLQYNQMSDYWNQSRKSITGSGHLTTHAHGYCHGCQKLEFAPGFMAFIG